MNGDLFSEEATARFMTDYSAKYCQTHKSCNDSDCPALDIPADCTIAETQDALDCLDAAWSCDEDGEVVVATICPQALFCPGDQAE